MSVTQFTKTSSTIGLCSLANFINAADRIIMPIAIIQMTDEFNWDLHGQGWVLSAFAVGYMSSQVMFNAKTSCITCYIILKHTCTSCSSSNIIYAVCCALLAGARWKCGKEIRWKKYARAGCLYVVFINVYHTLVFFVHICPYIFKSYVGSW